MKCAAFGPNSPTNYLWVAFLYTYTAFGAVLHFILAPPADPRCVFVFSGDCWTLHPWKDSPSVGQNKVPGSLRAHFGAVPLPAQVNNCVIEKLTTFSQLLLTFFLFSIIFFLFTFSPELSDEPLFSASLTLYCLHPSSTSFFHFFQE